MKKVLLLTVGAIPLILIAIGSFVKIQVVNSTVTGILVLVLLGISLLYMEWLMKSGILFPKEEHEDDLGDSPSVFTKIHAALSKNKGKKTKE